MGWDRHKLPWDGMGWDRKICAIDKPAHSAIPPISNAGSIGIQPVSGFRHLIPSDLVLHALPNVCSMLIRRGLWFIRWRRTHISMKYMNPIKKQKHPTLVRRRLSLT